MTRLEALRALYAAVKDGTAGWYDLPEMCEAVWGDEVSYAETVRAACINGSVDAAIALIPATLPGWAWEVSSYGEAWIWLEDYRALPDDDPLWNRLNENDDHLATALLLACIAAHIAIEERGE